MFFRKYAEWRFEVEVLRAILLIGRLNDDDVASPIVNSALMSAGACLRAGPRQYLSCLVWVYIAHAALSEFTMRSSQLWELRQHWLDSLDSANQHIWERCWPHLTKTDQHWFQFACPVAYSVVARILREEATAEELDMSKILKTTERKMGGDT